MTSGHYLDSKNQLQNDSPSWRTWLWFLASTLCHAAVLPVALAVLWLLFISSRPPATATAPPPTPDIKPVATTPATSTTPDIIELKKLTHDLNETKNSLQKLTDEVKALPKALNDSVKGLDDQIGVLKSGYERLDNRMPPNSFGASGGSDVLVIAVNSQQLDVNKYIDAFETLRGNFDLKRYYSDKYRLGIYVVTTQEWQPIVRLDGTSIGSTKFRRNYLKGAQAGEDLNPILSSTPTYFIEQEYSPTQQTNRKRCVLVVSTSCDVPKDATEEIKSLDIDAILVGRERVETRRAWEEYCKKHRGRACWVTSGLSDQVQNEEMIKNGLSFYLRQLTHPLVVFFQDAQR